MQVIQIDLANLSGESFQGKGETVSEPQQGDSRQQQCGDCQRYHQQIPLILTWQKIPLAKLYLQPEIGWSRSICWL